MKEKIEETTRLLLQGTITKAEADKILLDLHKVKDKVKDGKFVLYKAGAMDWKKYATYNSKQEMINDLINSYGVDELKDCDDDFAIDDILYDYEFKYEEIKLS